MKHIQFIVTIVAVVATVHACQTICGPWILTNKIHLMAQGLGIAQSPKTIENA